MTTTLTMKIRRKTYSAETIADLSKKYAELRDASDEGGSTWRPATITDSAGNAIGYISYNAKVWPVAPKEWTMETPCLYNPYEAA